MKINKSNSNDLMISVIMLMRVYIVPISKHTHDQNAGENLISDNTMS